MFEVVFQDIYGLRQMVNFLERPNGNILQGEELQKSLLDSEINHIRNHISMHGCDILRIPIVYARIRSTTAWWRQFVRYVTSNRDTNFTFVYITRSTISNRTEVSVMVDYKFLRMAYRYPRKFREASMEWNQFVIWLESLPNREFITREWENKL